MIDHGFRSLLPIAALVLWACSETPVVSPPQAPAAVMLGEWRYARIARIGEGPAPGAGFFVSIAIDSVAGAQFAGRVTAWFVGDVGLPVDRFGPVSGTVDDAHALTLRIAARAVATESHTIIGQLEQDEIVVLESWVGPNAGPFPVGGRFRRLQ